MELIVLAGIAFFILVLVDRLMIRIPEATDGYLSAIRKHRESNPEPEDGPES